MWDHAALATENGSKGLQFLNQFLYFLKRLSASETLLHSTTATFLTARPVFRKLKKNREVSEREQPLSNLRLRGAHVHNC